MISASFIVAGVLCFFFGYGLGIVRGYAAVQDSLEDNDDDVDGS